MYREILSQPPRRNQEEQKKAPVFDPIPGLSRLGGLGLFLLVWMGLEDPRNTIPSLRETVLIVHLDCPTAMMTVD
jgi:hypothetical protein